MEAKELMIGDFISYHGKIYQVLGIKEDNDGIYRCLVEDDNHFGWWLKLEDIQPIPLTSEILEKNGFIVKHPESTKRTYWKDRAGQIVGHKNRGLMYMEISGNPIKFGYFLPHFSGHILFVHEFQHSLRLCGIDKEITL